MTKIFRSSFYRSKQPEPLPEEEEESAAGEYVDLEDGQGKHGKTPGSGGGGCGDLFPRECGIFLILMACPFLVCACLMPKPVRDNHVGAMVGAMYLAVGATVLAVHACTSWWRSSDYD